MLMMMMMMMIMLSTIFMFLNHPLTFGLILLLQTMLTSIITGLLNYNYWFSYILFLIMIGGMLILFMYMTSVAANEKFKFSSPLMVLFLMFSMLIIMSNIIDNYMIMKNFSNYNQMPWLANMLTFQSIKKFLNFPSYTIMIMMILYLLITLIAIVKISKIKHGPLRQTF